MDDHNQRRQRNPKKHKIEAIASRWRKIGGGITAGVTSGHLSSYTNTSSLLSTVRGE
jgi:hypothetical protein